MADIRAAQASDFSSTATWIGNVVPGSGDVAYANGFNVSISDTRIVQAISNAAAGSPVATVGGTFSLLNGCNLTTTNANGVIQGATTTSVVTTAGMGAAQTAIINGNFPGGGGGVSITHSTASTLRVLGNMTQPAGSSQGLLNQSGSGFFEVTGNITLNGTARGILCNTPGAPSFTCTGTIVSSLTGGSDAIQFNSAGTFTATANMTNNSNVCPLIVNNSTGTMRLIGILQATGSQPVVGAGSTPNIAQKLLLSGPFLMSSTGTHAVVHPYWRWIENRGPSYMEVANSTNSAKDNLRTGDNMPTGGYPTAGNVLSTAPAYGDNSQFQGTYAAPAASSVASGVTFGPAGALTGTAVLTAADVRAAVGMASANLDTQLAGISAPSAATVASAVRTELGTELGRIDAAVSSRLAPSGTLARVTLADTTTTLTNAPTVPSAAAIASQVRTELTMELARLDVAISTRLAAASYSAAPTTAAIRTELAVELARLDVAVSSRLAPAGTLATVTTLTNAPSVPSAATIASQVRTELTPELARIANCSTVDTTAATVQDAANA